MDKEYTKTRKDGTPAKKPGPKPKNNSNPVVIETKNGPKEITNETINQMTTEEVVEANVAMMEQPVEKIRKPVNYDGFTVRAVQGIYGRYFYDKTSIGEYIDFENNDGDEISMTIDNWKMFIAELKHAAEVLGVEL